MHVSPDYYREKVRETLGLAARARSEQAKAYLLSVAARYERLADEADLHY